MGHGNRKYPEVVSCSECGTDVHLYDQTMQARTYYKKRGKAFCSDGCKSKQVKSRKKKEPRFVDGVELWECSVCKKWLPSMKYMTDKRSTNGLMCCCRHCHNANGKRYRDSNPEKEAAWSLKYRTEHRAQILEAGRRYREENREKERARGRAKYRRNKDAYYRRLCAARKTKEGRARDKVKNAVHNGKLIKPDRCSTCGAVVPVHQLHGHHEDYDKPLDVIWECSVCHGKRRRIDGDTE